MSAYSSEDFENWNTCLFLSGDTLPPRLSGTPPTQETPSNSEPDAGLKYHRGEAVW